MARPVWDFILFLLIFVGAIAILALTAKVIVSVLRRLGYGINKTRRGQIKASIYALYQMGARPRPRFQVPYNVRRGVRRHKKLGYAGTEKNINLLVGYMFTHMDAWHGPVPRVVVVHSGFDSFSGARRMGSFSSGAGTEIELMLKPDQGYHNIAAVLAHECTHYYMYTKNVHARPPLDEELMTDICAVMLGFHHQLYKGYHPIQRIIKKQQQEYVQRVHIGYLKYEEVSYVRAKVHACGRAFAMHAKQQQQQAEKAGREWQRQQYKAAEEMRQQEAQAREAILQARAKLTQLAALGAEMQQAACAPAQLEALQAYFTEHARGDISAAVAAAEQAALSGTAQAVVAAASAVRPWLMQMDGWIAAIQQNG